MQLHSLVSNYLPSCLGKLEELEMGAQGVFAQVKASYEEGSLELSTVEYYIKLIVNAKNTLHNIIDMGGREPKPKAKTTYWVFENGEAREATVKEYMQASGGDNVIDMTPRGVYNSGAERSVLNNGDNHNANQTSNVPEAE